MDTIQAKLELLGLTTLESTVYVWLLERSAVPVSEIAKKTGILRTNCYHVLDALEIKGLVEGDTSVNPRVYSAKNPKNLQKLVTKQQQHVDELIPELVARKFESSLKPQVTFLRGDQVFSDILAKVSVARSMYHASVGKSLSLKNKTFIYELRDVLEKKNIKYFRIGADNKNTQAIASVIRPYIQSMRETGVATDVAHDIFVWDTTVAIVFGGAEVGAIYIKNAFLADIFFGLFSALWNLLPENTVTGPMST